MSENRSHCTVPCSRWLRFHGISSKTFSDRTAVIESHSVNIVFTVVSKLIDGRQNVKHKFSIYGVGTVSTRDYRRCCLFMFVVVIYRIYIYNITLLLIASKRVVEYGSSPLIDAWQDKCQNRQCIRFSYSWKIKNKTLITIWYTNTIDYRIYSVTKGFTEC